MLKFNQGWKEQQPEIIRIIEQQNEIIEGIISDLNKLKNLYYSFSAGSVWPPKSDLEWAEDHGAYQNTETGEWEV